VYHADHGLLTLKELGRVYTSLTQDANRVMSRLKAIYRSRAIPHQGKSLYLLRRRDEWVAMLLAKQKSLQARALHLFEELDALQRLRHQARTELLAESRE
jgi:hypothetical protein